MDGCWHGWPKALVMIHAGLLLLALNSMFIMPGGIDSNTRYSIDTPIPAPRWCPPPARTKRTLIETCETPRTNPSLDPEASLIIELSFRYDATVPAVPSVHLKGSV